MQYIKRIILLQTVIICATLLFAQPNKVSIEKVRDYISKNWLGTVENNPIDIGNLYGLPKPYNVPTVQGENLFKELYYWDTYFTNIGLIHDNLLEQAKNNVDDILFMVNRFGKMLNGSNKTYLNRSQPPYLSMMVADIYDKTHDKVWLKNSVATLEKEYQFWMKERLTNCGLNRYSSSASDNEKIDMANYLKIRLNNPNLLNGMSESQLIEMGSHYIAEAESGWDFNPRFVGRCEDFCPIDLNSNLYIYEMNFARFYKEIGMTDRARRWKKIAHKRKLLINQLCYNKQANTFYDYDFVNHKQSTVVSSAIFSVFFAKIASQNQVKGINNTLSLLETKYGIRACEDKNYKTSYQWGSSNGWAPLFAIAVKGLNNYGLNNEANRIKNKYLFLVINNFDKTGNLWEKYNIIDGSVNTTNEYEMPAFLGWTAGVFVYFSNL